MAKRRMSKAQRQDVSNRMKAYWAKRRKHTKTVAAKPAKKTKRSKNGPREVVLGSPNDKKNLARSLAAEAALPSATEHHYRWKFTVLAHNQDGAYEINEYLLDDYGEMTDILYGYMGIPIERFWAEPNT